MSPRLVSEFRSRFAASGMTGDLVRDFQNEVMEFYETKGRHDMEWRHNFDPYRIVVSEVMLQQTQVPRVAVMYPQFIEKFPDFAALAAAPQAELLAAWQGMGYNRRALNLQKLAVAITHEFGGVLPEDPEALAALPGIGPATSCSIAAFAFNRPVVFIETNIRRVFIHYFFSDTTVVDDRDLLPLVEACLLPGRSREWYWALMDLGTALKTSVPNPNRRSRQYVKQSAFAGSDRQIRGALLRLLLAGDLGDCASLAKAIGASQDRVAGILDEMCREGFFVQEEGGGYRVR
ncbi:A/G-specific adenine glycosylase [Methanocorpusculum vombati]|uniref:A/G-specific adenine glycosylase n=1 Tax=Methanocorpusculum vombati TaxID=3002864 RepID=A0ABT4IN29_9EURY|nr:A/G-specific adenine glycosylase [Methanocorpusculum vombati]MCZ9319773.1 A/G-specific adenine glycosylase [Methanocorpusculum sp.]MCZ0863158.1 A/G-specific adenine glycosylase [Methanocorpusculum vombati]MDE2520245.1 A/G-specific adenine glycosylase [Methanocorpusculum sp.]MDE2533839.1 A/G-specific adenine glycosylase [Methanocorpusculum sp.]MDE2546104.1 A/G-specific adenine glycosylase [Methanocorpusculum sp.]